MGQKETVEAALFVAGRPISVQELRKSTCLDGRVVGKLLRKLAKDYRERGSAIEITRTGRKWSMQLSREYVSNASAIGKPAMNAELLKTAALVAYHQPVKRSDLVAMVGERARDHVKELEAMKLLITRPCGHTVEIVTSRAFPEYFGLSVRRREDLKRFMAEKVGLKGE